MALKKETPIGRSTVTGDYLRVGGRIDYRPGGRLYVKMELYESAEARVNGDGPIDDFGLTVNAHGMEEADQDALVAVVYRLAKKYAPELEGAVDVLEEGQSLES